MSASVMIAKLGALSGVTKGAIVTCESNNVPRGATVVDGPFANPEQARRLSPTFARVQRKFVMAHGEEVRLHGANGAYLFSVRLDALEGPVIVFDRAFSDQRDEYKTRVELYPWLAQSGQRDEE